MKKFLESESTLCLATQPSDFPLDEAQGQRRVREDMVLEDNVESVKCVHSISLQAWGINRKAEHQVIKVFFYFFLIVVH